jgi:glycerol-3-phosphate acyltransferase PlsY
VFFAVIAYLMGSIPCGLLVAKAAGIPDPRSSGTENLGAANLTRIGGRKVGALTFVLDFLKGLVPVLAAQLYFPLDPAPAHLAALLAVTGHCYSVFLLFRGGRGVATFAGALLPLAPASMLCALTAWLVTFHSFRVTSLAAMVALAVLMCALLAMGAGPNLLVVASLCCLMVMRRHRSNLQNLLEEQERVF